MIGDTAPIRSEERFDESRLAAYLREQLPGLLGDHPIEFAQFPGGKANLTYLVRAGDIELVVRRPPLGDTAPGSHDMLREYRVLSVLHRAFPAAPVAHHYCADNEVIGKPFVVMERRRGFVIRDSWPGDLPATTDFRRTVAGNLVDTLADLHRVDYGVLGLGDLGRPDGFAGRQVAGWTDRWQRARQSEVPAMDEVAARLASSVPDSPRPVLLHNDFKLDNTMVDRSGSVVAVLDWDMATLGDPLIDLGTTLSYWGGDGSVMGLVAPDATLLGAVMPPGEVADRYASRTGLDLTDLDWYRALGMFRIAVIVQQIYIRFVRGQTTDERFAGLGSVVAPMAESALALL